MCIEYDHDHVKLAYEVELGKGRRQKCWQSISVWIVFTLLFLLYRILQVLSNGQALFFLTYICSKFLLVPFLQKVSPPPCQGDICAQAPSPHVSVCFPSLSDSDPHKFHICLRLLSPHMQHQTEADSLSPWSRPFPHSPPTAQRVWLLY